MFNFNLNFNFNVLKLASYTEFLPSFYPPVFPEHISKKDLEILKSAIIW